MQKALDQATDELAGLNGKLKQFALFVQRDEPMTGGSLKWLYATGVVVVSVLPSVFRVPRVDFVPVNSQNRTDGANLRSAQRQRSIRTE